jgi:hypothetical protein
MKFTLLALIYASSLIAGVDSVYTKTHIYAGEVIQATESHVYIFNTTYLKKAILKKNITRFVLDGGEVIVGSGIAPARYDSYLVDMFPNETDNAIPNIEAMLNQADSLEVKKMYSPRVYIPHKMSPEERSADALEDIAFVLKVQLGIAIVLLLLSFAAL